MESTEGPVAFARHNLKAQGITCVNEVIPYVHYIAATGGRFRPTPITVLLDRASFESLPHFGQQQIKRIKTGASNIQADADRCKQIQTVSLVNVTQSLDNNIYPPKLIWSAQPRCWPRPID